MHKIRVILAGIVALLVVHAPQALGTFIKAEYDKWGRVIAANGIKAE